MFEEMRHYVKEFFGYTMLILKERGITREERKELIRNSGLIEKCREYDGARYVLHYDVYDWCDYLMNNYKWPRTEKEVAFFEKLHPSHLKKYRETLADI